MYGLKLNEELPDIRDLLTTDGVNVDMIEKVMREGIKTATTAVVPLKDPDKKEWMDDEYLEMLKKYKIMKKVNTKHKFCKKNPQKTNIPEKQVLWCNGR